MYVENPRVISSVELVFEGNLALMEDHAISEFQGSRFDADFNRAVKVEFTDHRISSNAGVLLLREADSKLDLTSSIAAQMVDTRTQNAIRYPLSAIRYPLSAIRYPLGDLLRERVYAMTMGYSAQDDVD